jgi:hypothetical protein
MYIEPFSFLDITPSLTGFLNLYTMSNNGTYEIREYACSSPPFALMKTLLITNYTDIPINVMGGYCIAAFNLHDHPIHFTYLWSLNTPANIMMMTLIFTYIIVLLIAGICILCCCAGIGFTLPSLHRTSRIE